jgi:hypothetical protein
MQHLSTLNAASISLLQRLQHFQAIFRAADASGNGSLDEEEFRSAFKGGAADSLCGTTSSLTSCARESELQDQVVACKTYACAHMALCVFCRAPWQR